MRGSPDMPLHMLFADSEMAEPQGIEKTELDALSPEAGYGIVSGMCHIWIQPGLLKQSRVTYNASALLLKEFMQPRNTIHKPPARHHRLAPVLPPFAVQQSVYLPEVELAVFVVANSTITAEMLEEAIRRIGETGFGKDASVGLGRFVVVSASELDLASLGSAKTNACDTLAPCVPRKGALGEFVFHALYPSADIGASSRSPASRSKIRSSWPMTAQSSRRSTPKQVLAKPYFGSAVLGVSKAQAECGCNRGMRRSFR
jgi:hypothetical protein